MPFAQLGLSPRLLKGVAALGYSEPTPIQREAIPQVLDGRDVVGVAQTGTGKTAAFVLPVLERTPTRQGIRTLVVTPTRELALQIAEVVRGASRATGHKAAVVFGGVGIQPQVQRLRKGVDILIACPGRLLDLHGRGVVDLSNVDTLVLDEADRMLDMGFWPDVRRILALLPEERQNLLFSATMDPQVVKIVDSILTDPVRVEVAPPTKPVDRIEQSVYPVARMQKTDLLLHLLERGEHNRALVFTRTKHRADRLAKQLERAGVKASAIHGDRSQNQRQNALEAFRSGKRPILVATDVVARGIDVDGVSHVVNYDMPNTAEDYVHRIGRTARAGATGTAISFLDPDELPVLTDIERVLGATLVCEDAEGFVYSERVVPDPERTAAHIPSLKRSGRQGGKGRASRRLGLGANATGKPADRPAAGQSSKGESPKGRPAKSQAAKADSTKQNPAKHQAAKSGQPANAGQPKNHAPKQQSPKGKPAADKTLHDGRNGDAQRRNKQATGDSSAPAERSNTVPRRAKRRTDGKAAGPGTAGIGGSQSTRDHDAPAARRRRRRGPEGPRS